MATLFIKIELDQSQIKHIQNKLEKMMYGSIQSITSTTNWDDYNECANPNSDHCHELNDIDNWRCIARAQ